MIKIIKNLYENMLKRCGVLLFFLLLTSCKLQNNQPIIIDMFYHDARPMILQNGWKPVGGLSSYDDIDIAARNYRDMGYTEVDDCSGSGLELCTFYFKNDQGEYLSVGTEGEDNGGGRYPRITYATIRSEIE